MTKIGQLIDKAFSLINQLDSTSTFILVGCVVAIGFVCMRGLSSSLK